MWRKEVVVVKVTVNLKSMDMSRKFTRFDCKNHCWRESGWNLGQKVIYMDVMAYRFFSGQIAIWRIKYIFFSKKLMMWKSVRWPGPFVKEVLVDWEDYCIVSGAGENFIFWLILILLALLLN